jgi:hypothetical protein
MSRAYSERRATSIVTRRTVFLVATASPSASFKGGQACAWWVGSPGRALSSSYAFRVRGWRRIG